MLKKILQLLANSSSKNLVKIVYNLLMRKTYTVNVAQDRCYIIWLLVITDLDNNHCTLIKQTQFSKIIKKLYLIIILKPILKSNK